MQNILFTLAIIALAPSAFAENKFSHESELTMIVVGGNSQSNTYNAKTTNGYQFTNYKVSFGGHYTLGTSKTAPEKSSSVSVRNWDATIRLDRDIRDNLSMFLAETLEGDKFSGYESRYNTDFGVSYSLIKTDKTTLKSEVGYRYTVEKNILNITNKDHKARLYAENTNLHNKSLSTKIWAEYIPNFSVSDDWQLNFGPALVMQLSSLLSLKLGYEGKYDNKTTSHRKFDFNYTTSLIAKF